MPDKTDYTNRTYGQITLLHELGPGAWWGRCSCGKEQGFRVGNVVSGNTKSCGCRRIKHGCASMPEYKVWQQMVRRCHDKRHEYYKDYGGRGITVDPRWRASVLNFLEDMGRR